MNSRLVLGMYFCLLFGPLLAAGGTWEYFYAKHRLTGTQRAPGTVVDREMTPGLRRSKFYKLTIQYQPKDAPRSYAKVFEVSRIRWENSLPGTKVDVMVPPAKPQAALLGDEPTTAQQKLWTGAGLFAFGGLLWLYRREQAQKELRAAVPATA